jgi:site-specific recombinase XerC
VVQRGKGGKRRVVGMDAGTAAMIQGWLSFRAKCKISRSAPLICTLTGGTKSGIEKRVHPHGLRHAYAIDLIHEGATITTTRDLLGHSSVAVTDRYLTRIGSSEAIDFARSRVWHDARSGENAPASS